MGTEAAQIEASSSISASGDSSFLANPLLESPAAAAAQEAPFVTPRFRFSTQPVAAYSANKRKNGAGNKAAQEYILPPSNNGSSAAQISSPSQGVSNCYIFKSRLQEYAQKKGLATPVYETIKEGPSHEPSFRSTVIVRDVRYDSLPGFFNRKAAEQSAAEVALTELAKSDEVECISQPVHETGLCKNLLQEYAQKMNFAIPLYQCQKVETPGRGAAFKCTVEIGGIQYIGGSAKTKREAEIKVARTALLAIQSSTSESSHTGNSQLTVLPVRKRGAETAAGRDKAANVLKAKTAQFKKKMSKNKLSKLKAINNNNNQSKRPGKFDVIMNQQSIPESDKTPAIRDGLLPVPAVENVLISEICSKDAPNDFAITANQNGAMYSENRSTTADFNLGITGTSTRISPESNEDAAKVSGVAQADVEPSTVMTGLNPLAGSGQI